MKPLIVILAVCTLGYAADHWQELKVNWQELKVKYTLLAPAEAPGLIVYGSKSSPDCVRLAGQLTKQGIPFQKRDLGEEANLRELTDKLARVGRAGGHINMPVAEIDGVLIQGASIEKITKRLR